MRDNEVKEVTQFYAGAKVLVPFIITIVVTAGGWFLTSITTAKQRGVQEEIIREQGIKIAKAEGRFETMEKRIQTHEVALGQLQVQLARIEKVGDETNRLLNELVRKK